MRSLLATILAALAFAGLAPLSAAAASGGNFSEAVPRDRGAAIADKGTAQPRLHLARAVIGDDAGDVRPRRRLRADDRWQRPRHAKPRHARTAKHARKHAKAQRRVVRGPARIAVRPYPLWRALAGAGQDGVASYYWQGQRLASGGRFNPNAMTAAHRTLPFGTRVRVTHMANGRSVEVRINDRGPYIAGRIIDLSQGAAGVIGMHGQGIARVRVTVLGN